MTFIPEEQYAKMITMLPILCVDVLIRNARGEYLLVKRANEPKKGAWWLVGGRVMQDETLEQAALRKVREEIGYDAESAQPVGYFEHVFDSNSFGTPGRYHTVSVVFSIELGSEIEVRLDEQSHDWTYSADLPEDFVINPFQTAGAR